MLADGMATMFGIDRPPVDDGGRSPSPQLGPLFSEMAGASFGGGLYRVHTGSTAGAWTAAAEAFFPAMAGRIVCFGADWLGRQFALDRARRQGKRCLVLLLDPGTGEAMEIPATVAALHTDELVHNADDALALGYYADWREATGDDDFIGPDECVGYSVPLFLGGDDDVENLARIDMAAYWSITAQLYQGTTRLRRGSTVHDLL